MNVNSTNFIYILSSFLVNKLDILYLWDKRELMKITDYISNSIDRLPKGYVFTYTDLMDEVNQKEAIIKALNRMTATGKIMKLSKGKFYKPENTPFGYLQPSLEQVAKDLLEKNGKLTGYLTGYSIYNKLGLTTQVSNTIQIGSSKIRPSIRRGKYKIAFLRQKNTITRENIPLLQILDTIRNIKKIPDSPLEASLKRLRIIIKRLSDADQVSLAKLALKYTPFTRALLGALLEEAGNKAMKELLKNSLNPITTYSLPGKKPSLQSLINWNIQ